MRLGFEGRRRSVCSWCHRLRTALGITPHRIGQATATIAHAQQRLTGTLSKKQEALSLRLATATVSHRLLEHSTQTLSSAETLPLWGKEPLPDLEAQLRADGNWSQALADETANVDLHLDPLRTRVDSLSEAHN